MPSSDSNFIQLHLQEAQAGFFLPSQSTDHSHYQNITSTTAIIMHCNAPYRSAFHLLPFLLFLSNYRYKLQHDNANGSSSGCTEKERKEERRSERIAHAYRVGELHVIPFPKLTSFILPPPELSVCITVNYLENLILF